MLEDTGIMVSAAEFSTVTEEAVLAVAGVQMFVQLVRTLDCCGGVAGGTFAASESVFDRL